MVAELYSEAPWDCEGRGMRRKRARPVSAGGWATDGGWVTGHILSTTYASADSSVRLSWDPFRQPISIGTGFVNLDREQINETLIQDNKT